MLIRGRRRLQHGSQRLKKSDSKQKHGLRRASELAVSRGVVNRNAQKLHTLATAALADRGTNQKSALESLPVEIIQQIFFWSLEVNLARSSTCIANLLSSGLIYNALILFAYFDDDGEGPVEGKHFKPAEYRTISCDEKLRLQSEILTCRWCTLDRVKSCMPILSRLKMVQAWHAERFLESLVRPRVKSLSELVVSNDDLNQFSTLPDLNDNEALSNHFWAKRTREDMPFSTSGRLGPMGAEGYLPRINTWMPFVDDQGASRKFFDEGVSILAARVIPDKLLVGNPWSETKLEFLQLLRQGLRFIPEHSTVIISAKALFEGMESAVQEKKAEVLCVLLELYDSLTEIESISANQRLPRKSLPLPLGLFHQALQQGPASSALLSLLVRADNWSVQANDQNLVKWAMQAREAGDLLGVWLSKYMDGDELFDNPRWPYLFNKGQISRQRDPDLCPFPLEYFASEIGYITDLSRPQLPTGLDGGPCLRLS